MKILYAALRHDPRNPDLASGVDYNFYSAFLRGGAEVKLVGPFCDAGSLAERALKRTYVRLTGKKYLKWNLKITRKSAAELNRMEAAWRPDLVFSLFPPPLAFYGGKAPCVFNTDTTMQGWQEAGAGFGNLALRFMAWEEQRAVRKSACIITFSDWCKNEIISRHGVNADRVIVQPMPSALPSSVVLATDKFQPKLIDWPLQLLLVGRDYERKGVPMAIEITKQLNQGGMPAKLTICGLTGEPNEQVRFAGLFRKSVPDELERYANLYRQAHLLIHPAVFEPAGIVPAEAAAFGVPTITNACGGLATSVTDGRTGIVLPKHSSMEPYVGAITRLLQNPDDYRRLSAGARDRYDREQNWGVVGKRVMQILQEIVASRN
jgi:glycosyltransferase involved in cell wall biosynthesis